MNPPIYAAVRAVGIIKPQFQGQIVSGKVFLDSLDVKGTAFWLRKERVLVTCAHVLRGIVELPLS